MQVFNVRLRGGPLGVLSNSLRNQIHGFQDVFFDACASECIPEHLVRQVRIVLLAPKRFGERSNDVGTRWTLKNAI